MPKYVTTKQLIGDAGESYLAYFLSAKLNALYRPISKRDTGIDGEIELTEQVTTHKFQATGIFIKVQVKTSTKRSFSKGSLSLSLSKDDIKYLASDINLPAILIFVDIASSSPKLYWEVVVPQKVIKDKSITIKQKNRLSKITIDEFIKIEMFYRGKKVREELLNYFNDIEQTILSRIEKSETDYGLAYMLPDYHKDLLKMKDAFEIATVMIAKQKVIPKGFDWLKPSLELDKRVQSLKLKASEILNSKGLGNYDEYIDSTGDDD